MDELPGIRKPVLYALPQLQTRISFLYLEHCKLSRDANAIDTVMVSKKVIKGKVKNYKLETLARYFGIAEQQIHRALPDALITVKLYLKLNELCNASG